MMNRGTMVERGFTARKELSRRRIEAMKQGDVVITMRVIHDNDRDEIQSDYCAGVFVDTLKSAIEIASR